MKAEVGDKITWKLGPSHNDDTVYSATVVFIFGCGYCVYVSYRDYGTTQDIIVDHQVIDVIKQGTF